MLMLLLAASAFAARSAEPAASDWGSVALRVQDREGRPLVARVRVVPRSLGERMRLWRFADALAIAEGKAEIALPAGEYELIVSRGPEWSLGRALVSLPPGARVARSFELAHEVELPGWSAADLHVHTGRSPDARDGGVSASALRAEGLALAVVTDHNRVGDLGEAFDALAGAEVTTWEPEVGHFNVFPLQQLPRWRGTSPARLFAELARQPAAFVQVNHPRLQDHIAYFALGGFDGKRFARRDFHLEVDGLEVWNGYDIERPDRVRALLAEWRGWVARGRRLTATGGSDSHGARSHHPGYPRTYVLADTAAELAPALKAGRAFVTNGPLLSLRVQGRGPGEVVHPEPDGRARVELAVLAPAFMHVEQAELWAGERLVWQARIPRALPGQPLRFSAQLRTRLRDVRALHAVVHGGSGLDALLGRSGVEPLAFTNPVYVARGPEARARR